MKDTNKQKPHRLQLRLSADDGYKMKIEPVSFWDKSFFRDIYSEACNIVCEILQNNTMLKFADKPDMSIDEKKRQLSQSSYNNIILISGERGSGKSSVMHSIVEAFTKSNLQLPFNAKKNEPTNSDENQGCKCESHHKTGCFFTQEQQPDYNQPRSYSFISTQTIDPSLFEESDSVLDIVIGRLFFEFDKAIRNSNNDIKFDQKKNVLKHFQTVFDNLKLIKSGKEKLYEYSGHGDDSLDVLDKLSRGINMRESLINLITDYLDFMKKDNQSGTKMLIIPIDDLDTSVLRTAEILEQIRKYLLIPNVLILISAKFKQLHKAIEQEYCKHFIYMLDKERIPRDEPGNITMLYMEKLLPVSRRLFLPEIRTDLERIDLFWENKKNSSKTSEGRDLQAKVLELTYRYTGLIFLKQKNSYCHYLVPETVRELHHYLLMLASMGQELTANEIDGHDNKAELHKRLTHFEDYFFNTWVSKNLENERYKKFLQELKSKSHAEKNRFVFDNIIMLADTKDEEFWLAYNAVKNNKNYKKNPRNFSIGDIRNLLDELSEIVNTEEIKKLIFAVKTYYSILFFNFIKIDEEDGFENAQKLLAGNVFTDWNCKKTDSLAKETDLIHNVNLILELDMIKFKSSRAMSFSHKTDETYSMNNSERFLMLNFITFPYRNKTHIDPRCHFKDDSEIYLNLFGFVYQLLESDPNNSVFRYGGLKGLNTVGSGFNKDLESYKSELMGWRDKYKAVLPLYSFEFMDNLYSILEGKKYSSYWTKKQSDLLVQHPSWLERILLLLFNKIQEAILEITKQNKYLSPNIVNAFLDCPISKYFLDFKPSKDNCNETVIGYLENCLLKALKKRPGIIRPNAYWKNEIKPTGSKS